VYSCLIVGALVQTLIFQDVDGDHLGFFGSKWSFRIKLMSESES